MSLSGVLYVCAAVSLFPAISSDKGPMSRHQLELKEHYEHLAKIAAFECDQPQLRLLHVNELLSDFQLRGKAYFPEVTVLHRCDRHVGSCNDGTHQCGPTLATSVSMPFKVTYLEDMGDKHKGEWEMVYHSMENHTSCGCLKYEQVQKPTKTSVHYHYVDPSLMPPQSFLPLETTQSKPGNASSYDVPVYTQQSPSTDVAPSRSEQNPSPSIYEMTKLAEEEVRPEPNEDVQPEANENVRPEANEANEEVQPEANQEEDRTKPNSCPACVDTHGFPGYPGNPSSEPSYANEVRDSSSPKTPSDTDDERDSDATTISSELIRFGAVDSPQFEALTNTDVESPYDTLLKKSLS